MFVFSRKIVLKDGRTRKKTQPNIFEVLIIHETNIYVFDGNP